MNTILPCGCAVVHFNKILYFPDTTSPPGRCLTPIPAGSFPCFSLKKMESDTRVNAAPLVSNLPKGNLKHLIMEVPFDRPAPV